MILGGEHWTHAPPPQIHWLVQSQDLLVRFWSKRHSLWEVIQTLVLRVGQLADQTRTARTICVLIGQSGDSFPSVSPLDPPAVSGTSSLCQWTQRHLMTDCGQERNT